MRQQENAHQFKKISNFETIPPYLKKGEDSEKPVNTGSFDNVAQR